MVTLILTVIGDDRPGLVQTLADVVVRGGGTWNQSSMSRLGSKFAGIVEVGVSDDVADTLAADLTSIGDDVLNVVVERSGAEPSAIGRAVTLELVGQDRPGIVHEISEALAGLGVGIDDLETTTSSAPMSGEQLFEARAVLAVPDSVERSMLAEALEAIAHELMVDLELADL
ncbi:MAG: ACT domain-containing protein [Actinomycetota bacterium]